LTLARGFKAASFGLTLSLMLFLIPPPHPGARPASLWPAWWASRTREPVEKKGDAFPPEGIPALLGPGGAYLMPRRSASLGVCFFRRSKKAYWVMMLKSFINLPRFASAFW